MDEVASTLFKGIAQWKLKPISLLQRLAGVAVPIVAPGSMRCSGR
jgi:hypothetical protein